MVEPLQIDLELLKAQFPYRLLLKGATVSTEAVAYCLPSHYIMSP